MLGLGDGCDAMVTCPRGGYVMRCMATWPRIGGVADVSVYMATRWLCDAMATWPRGGRSASGYMATRWLCDTIHGHEVAVGYNTWPRGGCDAGGYMATRWLCNTMVTWPRGGCVMQWLYGHEVAVTQVVT